jgi:MOSC domain-containing protein YiiM
MAIEKEILLNTMPQTGRVTWIGLRPEKGADLQSVSEAGVTLEDGLTGDHYHGKSGKRQVTLIQAEHLDAVAKILGKESINPHLTRRNIVVSGVNLLAFTDRRLTIGEVVLEATGLCHPCSRMEENLGPGGYNAMRGHGGLTTRVVKGGTIRVGDAVSLAPMPESVAEK